MKLIRQTLAVLFLLAVCANAQNSKQGAITSSTSACALPASSAYVVLPLATSSGSASVTLTGTFSATASFYASGDNGGSWAAILGTPPGSTSTVTSSTSTGTWRFAVGAMTHLCVLGSAYTSGTIQVSIQSSTASASVAGGSGGSVDWASPGTIGSTTPNTGAFTTLNATGDITNDTYVWTGRNGVGAGGSLFGKGTGPYNGIWGSQATASPSSSNYSVSFTGPDTFINALSGGQAGIRLVNVPYVSVTASGLKFDQIASASGYNCLRIDASGIVTNTGASCFSSSDNISGNAATATALASAPTLCSTGEAPTGILASGNATGCAAIGGSGTVSSGTTNTLAKYTGATTVGNSALTDDGTTLTYAGSGGFVISGSGSNAGLATLQGNTAVPSLPPNSFSWMGPSTDSLTSWAAQMPSAEPSASSVALFGTPSSHVSAVSLQALASGMATFFGTPSSANFLATITNETGTGLVMGNDTPTIITPTIADFTNATHNHTNAAGGGTLTLAGAAFANQGTTTTVLHGNASGNPSFSTIATADIASNAVTSAKMAVVNTRRTCDIIIGDTSGSALTNAQLGPQKFSCFIPFAATVVEVDVAADAGTPNIIVARNVATTVGNLVSSALATAASGARACSNTGGTTGIDGATTCSATLQNTALAAGSYIELVSGTAGGTAKLMTVHVTYTID